MEIIEESIFPERKVVYAAFSGRLVALIIDGLILLIPCQIIIYFMPDNRYVPGIVNNVVYWIYSAILLSGPNQATIGKKAMNIKITNLDGGRISFAQAMGRNLATLLSAVILCIGYFMMLWDSKSQTLHDKIAGTLAVCG